MALGFIKKIFSFGNKEVEQVPAEKSPAELDQLPTTEELYEDMAVQERPAEPVETSAADAEPLVPEPHTEELADQPEILPEIEPVIVEPAEIESVVEQLSEASDEIVPPTGEAAIEPVQGNAPETPVAEEAQAPVPGAAPKPSKVTVRKTVEEKLAEQPSIAEPERRLSWFERLRKGLFRSSQQLGDSIGSIFTKAKLDEDTLQDLEDVLIQADLGMETAIRITGALSATRYGKDISTEEVRTIMASEIEKVLGPVAKPLELDLSHKPHVILVVGVNGTGKTTTIGKLAAKLTAGGLNVMLAAGDTFRAAAIEQLHIWGKRTGAPVISSKLGADAAGLAFDAWKQAKEAGSDVLIIDTAGRLQNRAELMDELAKIVRVLGKNDPEAPHTVLQTLDATTGQNALNQVEIFKNIAGVNGLVMTKLDGTARGGILVAISAKHKLPVYFIGVGEQVEDLEPFAASDFAKAIAGVA
ncbi:signal recognition particle-docking protein FtsY [Phyllobacterium endophyticum]|uniref:Signal recognition particle receptor FtsY n=1 Tax=Phyllobacterium endophyticum TaxID=1149773 RepID=A0A2P7AZ23_9HYPH|nr:signal recognition particle-docking protein FtsY [Phyllobacterium endophyticum]MBB3235968.1 fused signal recognition particle receptor [Phyllobacterium endophyticum]PSH59453.1 signal recognition particle-docking protein FtsY [Phyllobacterium endophyticum]TYR41590.1 signal recognition particle-docking protein FtsY [Phyllobacterium endophyticum]